MANDDSSLFTKGAEAKPPQDADEDKVQGEENKDASAKPEDAKVDAGGPFKQIANSLEAVAAPKQQN